MISIYEDSKQRLWFTMLGRGFCSFNQDTEEFTTYDSSQGLANDVIYKIVEANNDILWLTSNKGLIRFDLKTKTSNIYADNNGLLTNQFNYSSGIKSKTVPSISDVSMASLPSNPSPSPKTLIFHL